MEVSGQSYCVHRGGQKRNTLAQRPPRGNLAGFLLDRDMVFVLPDYPYEIHDDSAMIIEAKTDEYGYFRHDDLVADHYVLKVNSVDYLLHTLREQDRPYQIRVLGETGSESDEDIRDITEDPEYEEYALGENEDASER